MGTPYTQRWACALHPDRGYSRRGRSTAAVLAPRAGREPLGARRQRRLMYYRRLVRDYEHRPLSSRSRVFWAMTSVMARRLTGATVHLEDSVPGRRERPISGSMTVTVGPGWAARTALYSSSWVEGGGAVSLAAGLLAAAPRPPAVR
jgi:hypothetical protein